MVGAEIIGLISVLLSSSWAFLLYAYIIIVVLTLLYEDREPAETVFWLIVLVALPGLGVVLYLLFGRNWRKVNPKKEELFSAILKNRSKIVPGLFKQYEGISNKFRRDHQNDWLGKISALIEDINLNPPLPAEDIKILPNGELKFTALKKDFANAKKSIHIQYFIWEYDQLTADLTEILLAALKRDVEVRILYDWAGSLAYRKTELRKLRKAGANVIADVREIGRLNYRNHRKIAVIDGEIGYTGGLNVGQEYIDGGKHYDSWRDTHLRITGPFVWDLQDLFVSRWYIRTEENLYQKRYFPNIKIEDQKKPIMAQLSFSSADYVWDATKRVYVSAILNAKKKVYIQSPYFIPDQPLYEAMATAALAGTEVILMMTGVPDKKVPWYAAQTFFGPLLSAGVKIYYYEAGFLHAKTLVVDDDLLSIGTTNFDIRSLHINNEDTALIYNAELVSEHYLIFREDLKKCRPFTLEDYNQISPVARLRNSILKLFSSLF